MKERVWESVRGGPVMVESGHVCQMTHGAVEADVLVGDTSAAAAGGDGQGDGAVRQRHVLPTSPAQRSLPLAHWHSPLT